MILNILLCFDSYCLVNIQANSKWIIWLPSDPLTIPLIVSQSFTFSVLDWKQNERGKKNVLLLKSYIVLAHHWALFEFVQKDLPAKMDLDVMNMFAVALGTMAIPLLLFMASFLLWPSSLIKIYYWWARFIYMYVLLCLFVYVLMYQHI